MATPSSDATIEETPEVMTEMAQPIIIDLGKQTSQHLKDLKEGEGELWDEVLDVVEEVKEMLGKEAEGKLMLPIIMLYEKKPARPRIEKILFPLADWDEDDDQNDDEEDED
jgi:hypothetical protein